MGKKSLKTTGFNLIADTVLCTAAFAGGVALYNGDGYTPLNLGLIAAGGIGLYRYHFSGQSYNNSARRGVMAAMSSVATSPRFAPFRTTVTTIQTSVDDVGFVFEADILRVAIEEYQFRRFIGIAVRRQNNALYGARTARHRTRSGGFRQIKVNWILSQGHFTKEVRPRFTDDEYFSILTILAAIRLLKGRKPGGAAGYLAGDYGENHYTVLAIERWLKLFPPPVRHQSLRSFFLQASRG